MKRIYLLGLVMTVFITQGLNAQISFSNQNNLVSNADFHSGVAVGITDMNGDGKDDILRMDQGYDLNIEYQNGLGETFTNKYIGEVGEFSQWSMCSADINNNGYNEVLAGGRNEGIKIVNESNNGSDFSINVLPQSGFFLQGSNFVDINNDGHLDAFACNDDGINQIWINDGAGNMLADDNVIDMTVDGSSDEPASGNYGSIWTDFDNDGDIDLYIAKCRQGVSDMTDKRRINQLYVNDGQGNFTEQGEEYGLRIGWQSWTADFQDVNNDGWLDCFITNHDYFMQLMINDGTGHFTEATNTGIDVQGIPVQGVMRDFDNDGFVDIIYSGTQGGIYRNNGDLTFTEVSGIFDDNEIESIALGDLNSDGFVDVYASYAGLYTNPSNIDDVVWINNGNNNNHLTVNLQGTVSNRGGVGARVEIYGAWGMQVREVRSGESYGIMNSMTQYFGLGTATAIDSVIVMWPSGITDIEYDVNVNSSIKILEGGCLAAAPTLNLSGPTTFCSGESLVIEAPVGLGSYAWSTGETSSAIEVTESGSYVLTITDGNECLGFSSAVNVVVDPSLTPIIEANGPISFCEGESVTLTEIEAPGAVSYTWSNGAEGNSVTVSESGIYTVLAEGQCSDFTSNAIEVILIATPSAPTADDVAVSIGDQAMLEGVGIDLAWYDVAIGGLPLAFGNTFTTPIINTATTFYVEDRNGVAGESGTVGMEEHSGTPFSGNQNSNNYLIFDALQPFTIDYLTMYTDIAGDRRIVVADDNGAELGGVTVFVPEGENEIFIGLEIPEGENLFLTTDEAVNVNLVGNNGPRLRRSSTGVNFPYEIEDIVSIKSSTFGEDWYYYFFNWKVSTPDDFCTSERTPVDVTLSVATINIENTDDIKVFPNPSNGVFSVALDLELSENVTMKMSDLTGRVVLEKELSAKSSAIQAEGFAKGMYTIQFLHEDNVYVGKIMLF